MERYNDENTLSEEEFKDLPSKLKEDMAQLRAVMLDEIIWTPDEFEDLLKIKDEGIAEELCIGVGLNGSTKLRTFLRERSKKERVKVGKPNYIAKKRILDFIKEELIANAPTTKVAISQNRE